MIKSREQDERPSGEHELEVKKPGSSRGPWDPFAYLRKTISPTQRMELLRLEVPVLPPEDFMDTADFRRARKARLRRWWPALVGLGAVVVALVFAGLWSHQGPSPSANSGSATPALPTQVPSDVVSALHPIAHVASPPTQTQVADSASAAVSTAEPPPLKPSRPERETPPTAGAAVHSAPRSTPASTSPPPPITPPEPASSGKIFWTSPR
jgi:hypothetical protein